MLGGDVLQVICVCMALLLGFAAVGFVIFYASAMCLFLLE